jgi:hypothetical protein
MAGPDGLPASEALVPGGEAIIYDSRPQYDPTAVPGSAWGERVGYFMLRRGDHKSVESFVFPISPEQLVVDLPARQTLYQTMGKRAFVDHLGAGVGMIQLSGHTSWRPVGPNAQTGIDGYLAFQQLRKIVEAFNDDWGANPAQPPILECVISSPGDFGVWQVTVNTLRLRRAANRPLLFFYELELTVLQDVGVKLPGERKPPLHVPWTAPPPEEGQTPGVPPAADETGSNLPGLPGTPSTLQAGLAQELANSYGLGPVEYVPHDYDPAANGSLGDLAREWYGENAELYLPILSAANGITEADSLGPVRLAMPVGFWMQGTG